MTRDRQTSCVLSVPRASATFQRGPSLTLVLVDIVVRVAHALNFLSVLVRNLDSELFFETHYQFNRVQRVGAEIVDEAGVGRHLIFVHAKLVNDNLFYFLLNLLIGHSFAPYANVRQTLVCRWVS